MNKYMYSSMVTSISSGRRSSTYHLALSPSKKITGKLSQARKLELCLMVTRCYIAGFGFTLVAASLRKVEPAPASQAGTLEFYVFEAIGRNTMCSLIASAFSIRGGQRISQEEVLKGTPLSLMKWTMYTR